LLLPKYIISTDFPAESLKKIIKSNNPSKILIITDKNTYKYCYNLISENIPKHEVFTILPGERNKNLNTCISTWDYMTDIRLDRQSILINFGGGIVCDIGGFCASCYKRGIPFVHLPTTLLAQVDASIGGKLGVNFKNYKNHIGVFKNPENVIICKSFLKTLPLRELKCGYAEMIKHSLVTSREEWKKQLSIDITQIPSQNQIIQSVINKYQVVSNDPKESGNRKVLNFGHTIGHALEYVFLNNKKISIKHGEAVAIGLIAESWISHNILGLPASELKSITYYIKKYFPKFKLEDIKKEEFVKALLQDKKNISNTIQASLLNKIGDCIINIPVSPELCWEALIFYKTL